MSIDQSGLAQGTAGTARTSPDTTGPTGTASGSGGGGSPSDKATAARDQTGEVAAGAASAGKEVAHDAKQQASQVLGQAKDQFHTIVGQARTEVQDQLGSKAGQAAGGLRTFSDQLTALRSGRPEEATQLTGYLDEAQRKVASLADRLDEQGVQGVVDDVTRMARRKPGLFLLGAVTAGFVVGRVMRAGMAAAHEDDGDGRQDGSSGVGDAAAWRTAPVGDDPRAWTAPGDPVPGTFGAPAGAGTPLTATPTVPVPAVPSTETTGLRTP